MTNVIHIGAGYGNEITVFHLRVISVAEENRYASRFVGIPDNESDERKAELEFAIFIDAIADWSEQGPTKKNEAGTEVPCFDDISTPAQAVREFFKERTPENERLAPAIIGRYRMKLQPDVLFL